MSTQKHAFQAEVAQLLHLVTHSLYSNKEIFLRELISNASDACDKLRYEALNNSALFEDTPTLEIRVAFDKKAKTLTISDNGIGMSQQEAIDHLGTIAKSGTRDFMSKLSSDQQSDAKDQGALIGQFGVGFYSGFIVADKIVVETRRAGLAASEGVRWTSGGTGEFEVEQIERPQRGTSITLHLRPEAEEFLNAWKIKQVIGKYSDHISLPILMEKEEWKESEKEGEPGQMVKTGEWEAVNKASALWTRPKKDITDEQYQEFYKHVAHDFEAPLTWAHSRVEGRQEYTQLLYIPARAPFDLWDRQHPRGLKLYVRRVFIMDDAEHLLPGYLRFVRGVVDSNDLPLNVSREILQSSKDVDAIRSGCTKRVLGILEDLAENEKEKYAKFWGEFGRVMKEGLGEDAGNRERLAGLMRFASTHGDTAEPSVSLKDYIARMKPGQDRIYYVTAETFLAAKNSPHLEVFRKRGVEVLLLSDRVDEWLVAHLTEFEGKKLASVARGDLGLDKLEGQEEKKATEQQSGDLSPLVARLKAVLGEKVKDVRISERLTESPSCLVADETDMGGNLARILKAAGQNVPEASPILEINPTHALVLRLKDEAVDTGSQFNDWAHLLFEQALLAEGGTLEDPAGFVRRLNGLMLNMAGEKSKIWTPGS